MVNVSPLLKELILHACTFSAQKKNIFWQCHLTDVIVDQEQIQFLLGHASVLTTERYLGCKQNLEEPVNDRFGCLFSGSIDSR